MRSVATLFQEVSSTTWLYVKSHTGPGEKLLRFLEVEPFLEPLIGKLFVSPSTAQGSQMKVSILGEKTTATAACHSEIPLRIEILTCAGLFFFRPRLKTLSSG